MDSIGRSGGKLLLVPKIKELNRLTNEIQAGFFFVLFCFGLVFFVSDMENRKNEKSVR